MTVESSFSNTIVRCIIEQTIWSAKIHTCASVVFPGIPTGALWLDSEKKKEMRYTLSVSSGLLFLFLGSYKEILVFSHFTQVQSLWDL